MTRDEAIIAMDKGTKVRVGRIKDPEHPYYEHGKITQIHGKTHVMVEMWDYNDEPMDYSSLAKLTWVHPVEPI